MKIVDLTVTENGRVSINIDMQEVVSKINKDIGENELEHEKLERLFAALTKSGMSSQEAIIEAIREIRPNSLDAAQRFIFFKKLALLNEALEKTKREIIANFLIHTPCETKTYSVVYQINENTDTNEKLSKLIRTY